MAGKRPSYSDRPRAILYLLSYGGLKTWIPVDETPLAESSPNRRTAPASISVFRRRKPCSQPHLRKNVKRARVWGSEQVKQGLPEGGLLNPRRSWTLPRSTSLPNQIFYRGNFEKPYGGLYGETRRVLRPT